MKSKSSTTGGNYTNISLIPSKLQLGTINQSISILETVISSMKQFKNIVSSVIRAEMFQVSC